MVNVTMNSFSRVQRPGEKQRASISKRNADESCRVRSGSGGKVMPVKSTQICDLLKLDERCGRLVYQLQELMHRRSSISEIRAAYLRIVRQRLGAAGSHDIAGFQKVGAIRHFQRQARVLLDQEDADPLFAPDPLNDSKNSFDNPRREPE